MTDPRTDDTDDESNAPFDYEHRSEPPLSRRRFLRRLTIHVGYGGIVVIASLVIGTIGFATLSHLSVVDSFLNASMLLGGMGPVGDLGGTWGKLFASVYALYSGLVFLILAGLLLAPVFHRVLHRFHWEVKQEK
jgi:hypothetical protein